MKSADTSFLQYERLHVCERYDRRQWAKLTCAKPSHYYYYYYLFLAQSAIPHIPVLSNICLLIGTIECPRGANFVWLTELLGGKKDRHKKRHTDIGGPQVEDGHWRATCNCNGSWKLSAIRINTRRNKNDKGLARRYICAYTQKIGRHMPHYNVQAYFGWNVRSVSRESHF